MLPKISLISKNTSNKSSSELNFLQKTQWKRMCISPRSGVRALQRLICLKYYNILKLESRFTLELNSVKNTNYMIKSFQ